MPETTGQRIVRETFGHVNEKSPLAERIDAAIAEAQCPSSELLPEDQRGSHFYLSTACLHDLHSRCRQNCKFCDVACECKCHEKHVLEATNA